MQRFLCREGMNHVIVELFFGSADQATSWRGVEARGLVKKNDCPPLFFFIFFILLFRA